MSAAAPYGLSLDAMPCSSRTFSTLRDTLLPSRFSPGVERGGRENQSLKKPESTITFL